MKLCTLVFTSLIVCSATTFAEGDYPWLAIPGKISLGVSHTEQSGDTFYMGKTEAKFLKPFELTTTNIRITYGWNDSFASDILLGQSKSKVVLNMGGPMPMNSSGITDTIVGLKWRVLDEFVADNSPSVTLRSAVILKGDYDVDTPAGIGKGANGIEFAATVGKQFGAEFSVSAGIGMQKRTNDVPIATFIEGAADWMFTQKWSTYIGISRKAYSGNIDISDADFTPDHFDEVAEERTLLKVGFSYAFLRRHGLSLHLSKLESGRNTVIDDKIVSLSYNLSF
jgi:Putative MetA-pathway of phenol degradation